MNIKKYGQMGLILLAAITFAGCGTSGGGHSSAVPSPSPSPTDEPTADPTAEPTADPSADPTTEPTEDPSEDPTEPEPAADFEIDLAKYAAEKDGIIDFSNIEGSYGRAFNVADKPATVNIPSGRTVTLVMDDGAGINTSEGNAALTVTGGGKLVIKTIAGRTINIIHSGSAVSAKIRDDDDKTLNWAVYTKDSDVEISGGGIVNMQADGGIFQAAKTLKISAEKGGTVNIKAVKYGIYHNSRQDCSINCNIGGTMNIEIDSQNGQAVHVTRTVGSKASCKCSFKAEADSVLNLKNNSDRAENALIRIQNADLAFDCGQNSAVNLECSSACLGLTITNGASAVIDCDGSIAIGKSSQRLRAAFNVNTGSILKLNGGQNSTINAFTEVSGIFNAGSTVDVCTDGQFDLNSQSYGIQAGDVADGAKSVTNFSGSGRINVTAGSEEEGCCIMLNDNSVAGDGSAAFNYAGGQGGVLNLMHIGERLRATLLYSGINSAISFEGEAGSTVNIDGTAYDTLIKAKNGGSINFGGNGAVNLGTKTSLGAEAVLDINDNCKLTFNGGRDSIIKAHSNDIILENSGTAAFGGSGKIEFDAAGKTGIYSYGADSSITFDGDSGGSVSITQTNSSCPALQQDGGVFSFKKGSLSCGRLILGDENGQNSTAASVTGGQINADLLKFSKCQADFSGASVTAKSVYAEKASVVTLKAGSTLNSTGYMKLSGLLNQDTYFKVKGGSLTAAQGTGLYSSAMEITGSAHLQIDSGSFTAASSDYGIYVSGDDENDMSDGLVNVAGGTVNITADTGIFVESDLQTGSTEPGPGTLKFSGGKTAIKYKSAAIAPDDVYTAADGALEMQQISE